MQETLTFEAMPQAILELMHKVDSLRADIGELRKHCQPPQVSEPMIGIDEACKILGRAKSTVYALTQVHKFFSITKRAGGASRMPDSSTFLYNYSNYIPLLLSNIVG